MEPIALPVGQVEDLLAQTVDNLVPQAELAIQLQEPQSIGAILTQPIQPLVDAVQVGVQRPLEEMIDTSKPQSVGNIMQSGANIACFVVFGFLVLWFVI